MRALRHLLLDVRFLFPPTFWSETHARGADPTSSEGERQDVQVANECRCHMCPLHEADVIVLSFARRFLFNRFVVRPVVPLPGFLQVRFEEVLHMVQVKTGLKVSHVGFVLLQELRAVFEGHLCCHEVWVRFQSSGEGGTAAGETRPGKNQTQPRGVRGRE